MPRRSNLSTKVPGPPGGHEAPRTDEGERDFAGFDHLQHTDQGVLRLVERLDIEPYSDFSAK